MYKKYWKELLIIGLVTYSWIGLLIAVIFFNKKWLNLMRKVSYDNESPKLVPVFFNEKEIFYKDENGDFQPMLVPGGPKYSTNGFMLFCTFLSIITIVPIMLHFIL